MSSVRGERSGANSLYARMTASPLGSSIGSCKRLAPVVVAGLHVRPITSDDAKGLYDQATTATVEYYVTGHHLAGLQSSKER